MPNRDIKNLRLTSSYMREVAPLRFHRVFLSTHPRDVDVFLAVAKHDALSQKITEIIYDDAPFIEPELGGDMDKDFFDSFERAYKSSLQMIRQYKGLFIERPIDVQIAKQLRARMTAQESYQCIKEVMKQQRQGHRTERPRDVEALREGLWRFTNLRRITITPFAHGLPFKPRSVFGTSDDFRELYEAQRSRGFRKIVRELAQDTHNIVEFVVENNQLRTGITSQVISKPGDTYGYKSLLALLSSPGFSRIDLPLWFGRGGIRNWHPNGASCLRAALGKAVGLQHVSLSTDLTPPEDLYLIPDTPEGGREHFTPLLSIFPVKQWPRLRHFGLSRFIVIQQDLLALLSALPSTIRSVELSYLFFLPHGGRYGDLLYDIKQELDWVHQPPGVRPELTLYLEMDPLKPGMYVDVSKDVNQYLYGSGVNPFSDEGDVGELPRYRVYRDDGIGIERDAFQPENDVPYMQPELLQGMGIYIPGKLGAL
ncbi:unnamed protein product [Clonostachys solani]|uniref:Uncharacterized protein n=1 Tax=Clonostachys solani TaxID=160281 RepID=A0A9N9ZMQ3_9HYPO|nr:unnamed protein product [Clonostachys solani]